MPAILQIGSLRSKAKAVGMLHRLKKVFIFIYKDMRIEKKSGSSSGEGAD